MSTKSAREVARKYDRLAPIYDSRWSAYVGQSVRQTLTDFDPAPGSRVLDVGCGTGSLLGELRHRRPDLRLTGIDLSPTMLVMARRRLGRAALLVRGTGTALPFASESFDVVLSTSSFHYLESPTMALLEVSRVLRSGGEIRITDWCRDDPLCAAYAWIVRLLGRAGSTILTTGECRRLLADTGFDTIELRRERVALVWGLMRARATSARGRGVQDC